MLALVAFFNQSAKAAIKEEALKVGFIMVGPVSDMGWNWAHDQGRIFLESKLGNRVRTTFAERVPENAEAERVMEKMIAQGARLIFMTKFGYLEPGLHVASRHPDVIFMQVNRPNLDLRKNVGTYFVDFSEPMYPAGIVAARMTKKNEIGYVVSQPTPPLLLNLNAFTLGVRSVNPKMRVRVVWTNSWSDPPTEAEAVKSLVDRGADIVASHFDCPLAANQACEKNSVFSVASNAGFSKDLPKHWLTGQCWNWGPLYVKIVNSVLDRSWKPGTQKYGAKDGYVALAPFGPAVPQAVKREALRAMDQIKKGSLVVFQGPLIDKDGKERIAGGKRLSDSDLESINWLVAGVEGNIPNK
jgi:basic membrane protein A